MSHCIRHCAHTVYIIVLTLCTSLCSHYVRHCAYTVYVIVLTLCTSLCSHCVYHRLTLYTSLCHTVYVIVLTLCMSLCSHTMYILVLTHCIRHCPQSFLTATTRAQITNRAARLSPHISAARTTRAGSCELYLRHQINGSHVESVLLWWIKISRRFFLA